MDDPFTAARRFLLTHGRLLERLVFSVRFDGASASPVGKLVGAYQNPDGGLGHALEPDLRCRESQPLFVEIGLTALRECRWRDRGLCESICGYLETVSGPDGLVPPLSPNALASPHAPHWGAAQEPGINPTAAICGLLHYQGVRHPWLARATATCCERIRSDPPREAHALRCAARLAEDLPDRDAANSLAERIAQVLSISNSFVPFAPVTAYGLTPLHFAESPSSPWRALFTNRQIDEHLTDLLQRQQADGGWPISWSPPGPAAISEWRGRWTLEALSALVAYGRVTPPETPGAR